MNLLLLAACNLSAAFAKCTTNSIAQRYHFLSQPISPLFGWLAAAVRARHL
jgi:hypothetical protein